MRLGLPSRFDRVTRHIDNRHRRLPPQADEEPLSVRCRQHRIGITPCFELNVGDPRRFIERHYCQPIAPSAADKQRLAVGTTCQPRRYEFLLHLGDAQFAMFGKISLFKRELMHDLELAAAGKQPLSGPIETKPVESLRQSDAGHDRLLLQIDDGNFMFAVARVQHGRPGSAGVDCHVDREIAELYLLARRPQRPLRRQQHVARLLQPRQPARRALLCWFFRGGSRAGRKQEEKTRKDKDDISIVWHRCSKVWKESGNLRRLASAPIGRMARYAV